MPSHGDISTRHFPDLSDASFQIPLDQHEDILAENSFDAFGEDGLDHDPFTTPKHISKRHPPLRLSDITPQREKISSQLEEGSTNARTSRGKQSPAPERQRQKPSSVRPVLLKKEPVDDMFARRKRDSYQQMGLDLTSKSTARFRRSMEEAMQDLAKTHNDAHKPDSARAVIEHRHRHAARDPVKELYKAKPKRPVLAKDAGISKQKHHAVPPATTTDVARPKSILKPPKPAAGLPASTLSRTLNTLLHTPKAERPKWNDVVTEVQQSSLAKEGTGGGLIDVLLMYGEKLKGSLGFSTSVGKLSAVQALSPDELAGRHRSHNARQDASPVAGPSSKPLTLSELSPTKPGTDSRTRKDVLTLSDLSPSKHSDTAIEEPQEPCHPRLSPMRCARKRTSPGTADMKAKKGRVEQKPTETERAQYRGKTISKPKPLRSSYVVNEAHRAAPKPSRQPLKPTPSHDPKGKSKEVVGGTAGGRQVANKEQQVPASLDVPSGPVFASDVYRHRANRKTQKEREKQAEKEAAKRTHKAGTMPYFSRPAPPARPAVRPTVPIGFRFESDARATQRNADFEEKRRIWESRTAPVRQALPMPNFAVIHAARDAAARRHAVPVLPTEAPQLTTMVRAREREKFEAQKREKERALEILREERERERAEEEERTYREARKKTVPKAHEVPEWYKDAPKRQTVG